MSAVLITLIPWMALTIGAIVTAFRRPSPAVTSAVQHFAAGVVFAAAAGEILPDLKHAGAAVPVMIGGSVGIAAMLVIRHIGERAKGPASMLTLVGIDMLIDGLVLGIAFAAGQKQGILLAIALTLEVLFLGLTVAIALGKAGSKLKSVAVTAAIGAALPLGALFGIPVAALPLPVLTAFYAFGLVALLYLVTEELLTEAHEHPETPWITSMFFIGFLLLLLLEETI